MNGANWDSFSLYEGKQKPFMAGQTKGAVFALAGARRALSLKGLEDPGDNDMQGRHVLASVLIGICLACCYRVEDVL